tara:strand:- start:8622 stop:9089 length:468 start_codon:yes stop_codon:yes gene_type:complete
MISNELILSLMFGILGFIWGVTRWQPFILTKGRNEPFLTNWSFPIKYIKPVFNFYYEHYGIIGSLYLAYIECFVWGTLVIYISLIFLKCIGYSLSIKGKVTDIKLLEVIALFVVLMIPNWLFKHTIPHDKKHQITFDEVFGMHPRAPWSGGKGIL